MTKEELLELTEEVMEELEIPYDDDDSFYAIEAFIIDMWDPSITINDIIQAWKNKE